MVARYGDFVLYRPQFKTSTNLLWLGPFALLMIVLILFVRRLRAVAGPPKPDESALAQARDLLEQPDDKK